MNKRVAEYICKEIEPENFTEIQLFNDLELDFDFNENDLKSSFKNLAYKIAFDEIDTLNPTYKYLFSNGASFAETLFVIWANNIDIIGGKVINQQYSINRSALWLSNKEILEDWETEI